MKIIHKYSYFTLNIHFLLQDVERALIKFELPHYETTVQSSAPRGTAVLTVRAFAIGSPDPRIRYHFVDYSECREVSGVDLMKVLNEHLPNDYSNTTVQPRANNLNNSNSLHDDDGDVIVTFKMGYLSVSEETGSITVETPLYLLNPQKNQQHLHDRQHRGPESEIPQRRPPDTIRLKQCLRAFYPSYRNTRFSHATVTVNVRRSTESRVPTFERKVFEATVECDAPSDMFVKDLSIASPANLTYALRKVAERGRTDDVFVDNILVINPKTGIVSIRSSVSLKKFCSVALPSKTADQSGSRASNAPANRRSPELVYNVSISDGMGVSFAEFRLRAKGANHHAPIFERVFYSVKVYSDAPHMTELVTVHARDEDEDLYYGGVEFKVTKVIGLSDLLREDDVSHWFTIDGQKGDCLCND